jgi:NAD(P)-dependent dehydrogenase (short-subunit alcohol dehydrogenase family)
MANFLIVGGTSGIGKTITEGLIQEGNNVITFSRNSTQTSPNDNHQHFIWDATNPEIPSIDFTHLDGLVYCPGTINLKPFHRFTDEEILEEFTTNTLGAVRILRNMLPLLKKSTSPSVVLFSTVAVQTGMPFHANISMAKGAIEGLTRSLAAEWAPLIRVNAIAPSLTQTPLAEKLTSTPEKIEASAKRHPLQKIGTPQNIADAALFLLSDKSAWMTGQIMHIDGGMGSLKLL